MSSVCKSSASGDIEDIAAASFEAKSTDSCNTSRVSKTSSCNDVPVLRRAAMDYLARREHSLFELIQKLSKKFPETDNELLLAVVEALKSENLQSDARFTESYVRYRKSKGFGYLHIKADLAARRISDNLLATYLLAEDEHWQITADRLIEKKLRHSEQLKYGSKLHRRLTRFLQARGFTVLESRSALEKHLA